MAAEIESPVFSSVGQLRLALSESEPRYVGGHSATLGDVLGPLGAQASALSAMLLALPFLSPMSLGAMTAPASLLIGILGWRLLLSAETMPLPVRLLALPLPRVLHRVMGLVLDRAHRWTVRFSRPRYSLLVAGRRGRMICGVGITAGALLLAVPIPLLPLTNTFPALGILCFGLGWAERDGLVTILGAASLLVSVVLFAGIGTAVVVAGTEAVLRVLPWIVG